MIGKGAVRCARVSFHTLTIAKLFGVVWFFHLWMCLKKCKTVKTLIGTYRVQRRVGGHM